MPSAQGHITVRRKAKDGADGVSRWLEPSVTEIRRYQTGDFSVATISCKKKRQVGANAPETASECTMRYTYTRGGTETTVENYTGSNITIGLWWSKIVFKLLLNGIEIDSREVLVIDTPASVGQNLLNGTNFKDEPDAGTTFSANKEVLENEVDGQAALRCVGTSFSDSAEVNLFKQKIITGTTEVRLMPSTWYTLSFWARSCGYVQEDIDTTFNTYGISNVPTFHAVAGVKYKLAFNGYVDAQTITEGRQLKVFVYRKEGDVWKDQHSASISSTTAVTQFIEFTPDTTDTYYIHAHLYPNLSGGQGQARVNWYRLYSYKLVSFVYSSVSGGSVIDTSAVQVSDGIISASKPSDGHNAVELTEEWVRHTFTFKTKSTLPTSDNMVLFRMPAGCYGMDICMPKLERGVFATDWCRSERDKTGAQGIDGCILRVSEWAEGVEFHNDEALTTGTRYLDIAVVTTGANTFNAYKCKQTHTSSSSIPVTNTTYWQPFNNLLPIYTPLIMAQYATLRFTQTNQLLVMDGNDIVSALGKGDYPLWIGGATAAAAPFKVTKAGKVVATRGQFLGYIGKQKFVITPENIGDYYIEDTVFGEWLDITDVGTFVEFSGNFTSEYIYMKMPSIYPKVTTYSSAYKDKVRSMVGNIIIVYNNSNKSIAVTGNNHATDNTAGVSFTIPPGYFCRLECKIRVVPNDYFDVDSRGYEEIYWLYSTGIIR